MHLWVKKLNLFIFAHAPKQNSPPDFYHYPSGRKKLPISPEQHFLKIYSPAESEGGEEDYGVEKITKIKPTRVLVTSFDKFHHLCNLCVTGFSFVVP